LAAHLSTIGLKKFQSNLGSSYGFFLASAHPEQSNLRFRAGDYNVTLFIWTNTDEKPSAVTKEVLTITPFVETFLAERKEKKDSTTRIIYFQNKAHIASVTNKEPDWREHSLNSRG
jgi:hypothetical protein